MRSQTELRLPLPTKVNRLWRAFRNRLILSTDARAKEKILVAEIHDQLGGTPEPYRGDVHLAIRWHPRDKRRCDIDSPIKQLLDVLGKAGVYEDDSQIVSMTVEKLPPQSPGLMLVEVIPLGPEPEEDPPEF